MRVLLELGRLLAADALRAAGRAAYGAAEALDVADRPVDDDSIFIPAEGELVPEEARAMVAAREEAEAPSPPPPLDGSLAARAGQVGKPWAL